MRRYHVYILSSFTRTIYIGVTSNLSQRLFTHKSKALPGFTNDYNVDRLVFFEEYNVISEAIAREKQLKRWSRSKKIVLIEKDNPT